MPTQRLQTLAGVRRRQLEELGGAVVSRGWERALRLPPPSTRDVRVQRDLRVPMRDGAVLLADHHAPRGGEGLPTVLVRSPYGRRGYNAVHYGRTFAERGYQVLVQSVRGTFGSGGAFDPFRQERDDGLDTIDWIERQPWFGGDLVMTGASYIGFVQWAVARDLGRRLGAMAVQVGPSEFRGPGSPGEGFPLEGRLAWTSLIRSQERGPLAALGQLMRPGRLDPAFDHLPLSEADQVAFGEPVDFWQDWLAHDSPEDPHWSPAVHSDTVGEVIAPVFLLGGWYDLFLPWTVHDYRTLRAAGHRPHLTLGPWTHGGLAWAGTGLRESLAWFDAHVKDRKGLMREAPVRLYVVGAERWRDYDEFPPPGTRHERWHLHGGGLLARPAPGPSAPAEYRYDPADPTPGVGGPRLTRHAGVADNRELEARSDVLTYTSAPLERDLELIGPVAAELYFASDRTHTDVFARLCDVDGTGRSENVCDALRRITPGRPERAADGSMRVRIELWPTARRVRRGHRLRLQVSSGAHPRLARNPGTGEPLGTAKRLVAQHQRVFHDPEHPSAIVLPVQP